MEFKTSFLKVLIVVIIVFVQSLCRIWLSVTLWTIAHQAPLSSTISRSLLKFTSIELAMLSNHLILCCLLLLLPSDFPSITVFSSELALRIRWPKYWSFSISSVQSLCLIWLFATPWTVARQASLSITNSQSLLKLISIESVMSSPSPPIFNLSQHRSLFQLVNSSYQVARVLEFQLQHQSFQWIFRVDFLCNWLVRSPC